MTIEVIQDSFASLENFKAKLVAVRTAHAEAEVADSAVAIAAILHCQTHGSAEPVIKLTDEFKTIASAHVNKAWKYLAAKYTGAKKDGTIDAKRQNEAKQTFMAELESIDDVGLVTWYDLKMGTAEEKEKKVKTEAEKHAAKVAKALELLRSEATGDSMDSANYKAMFEYFEAYRTMAATDLKQAQEMHQASLNKLATSASAALGHLKQVVNG